MEMLRGVKHRLGDTYRSVASAVIPQSGESRFLESGTLTPEEFIQAGDQLIFKFPTWQWAAAADPSRSSSCLPKDKQYLITRDVPCRERVRALDYVLAHKTRMDEEWTLPETGAANNGAAEIHDVDDLARAMGGGTSKSSGGYPGEDDSGASLGPIIVAQEDFLTSKASGLPDFSDLDAQLEEQDPASQNAACSSATADTMLVADAPDVHLVRSRTYDLSITYDKYYQTPRLWLFGYDEGHSPLKPEEVYEDVLSEYVTKTVTVDPHPVTGVPTVSIHPCKHAQVMKKVVDDWIEKGIQPRHDLAIFVFLKFISGIVPTINYDFTMDIEF